MLNDLAKDKIRYFLNDSIMSEAVKEVIQNTFLKAKATSDVTLLAAERIAINLLSESFKELEKCKIEADKVENKLKQIGL